MSFLNSAVGFMIVAEGFLLYGERAHHCQTSRFADHLGIETESGEEIILEANSLGNDYLLGRCEWP